MGFNFALMNITEEKVLNALSQVIDPDFKKDLVTLKMIENINISAKNIAFKLVLTTPACPLKEHLENECKRVLYEAFGESITIEMETTHRVLTVRDKADFLPGVKHIIAVASGKGGVGKSTVAVNLAMAMAKSGAKVGLLDADIYGPSIPIMFDLQGKRPGVQEVDGKHKIIPIEKYGVHLVSIGFLVNAPQAIVWRGPMVSSAIRQFVSDVIWGDLDYLFIDLPPGTGDIHLSIVSMAKPTGAVVVTTPQDVALADAVKAIDMFNNPSVDVPVLGIIENMSYFTPPDAPDKKYYIFGENGGKETAAEHSIDFIGELPLQTAIREGGDKGQPVTLNWESKEAQAFNAMADTLVRKIAVVSAQKIGKI